MTLSEIAAQIKSELSRLSLDTNADPYSGISVEVVDDRIQVFDDYADTLLEYPDQALQQLRNLKLGDFETVWSIFAHS